MPFINYNFNCLPISTAKLWMQPDAAYCTLKSNLNHLTFTHLKLVSTSHVELSQLAVVASAMGLLRRGGASPQVRSGTAWCIIVVHDWMNADAAHYAKFDGKWSKLRLCATTTTDYLRLASTAPTTIALCLLSEFPENMLLQSLLGINLQVGERTCSQRLQPKHKTSMTCARVS
jgi:hypothetical protein